MMTSISNETTSRQKLDRNAQYNFQHLHSKRLAKVEPFSASHPFGFTTPENQIGRRMVATQDILEGETILVEKSPVWVPIVPQFPPVCFSCGKLSLILLDGVYCSPACVKAVHPYHCIEQKTGIYDYNADGLNNETFRLTLRYIALNSISSQQGLTAGHHNHGFTEQIRKRL